MSVYETNSEKETYDIGHKLGTESVPGNIYCLIGDL